MSKKKRLIARLLFGIIGIATIFNNEYDYFKLNTFAKEVQNENRKSQKQTGPLITYESQQIGDREKLKVTVRVEDRGGVGIKEFRDHKGKLINGNSYTFEINKRGNYTFTAIDNNNQESSIKIDDFWVNPYTNEKVVNIKASKGSSYWSSSNMREWLNSKESAVNYTSNPPTNENLGGFGYDKEAGFLNQFTQDEIDAIAVTKHRVWVNSNVDVLAKEGGDKKHPGHLNHAMPILLSYASNTVLNYKDYSYKSDIDKVYLLSPYEFYWYLNRRGFEAVRPVTDYVKSKYKLSDNKYDWFLAGSTEDNEMECMYKINMSINNANHIYLSNRAGIVPLINLKPEYILSSGKKASDLRIGEKVVFGKYSNSPIKWEVINISDSGYPMLLSANVLDIKRFDGEGDQSRMYSDYVTYENHDLDLVDDIQYKSTKMTSDIDVPKMKLLNESDLNVRKNNGYNLHLQFSDEGSGIEYIIKPDGSKTVETNFEYLVAENGDYIFKVMDKSGNYNEFGIPVGNINQEPVLTLEQSKEGWSNEDIEIDIKSSNSVKQVLNKLIDPSENYYGDYLPNYISYADTVFKVSGTVEVDSYDGSIFEDTESFCVGVKYQSRGDYNDFSYIVNMNWITLHKIKLNELIEKGSVDFEFEAKIPLNYFRKIQPWGRFTMGFLNKDKIKVNLKNLTYEIKDDSDFAIQSIELPNGRVINNVKEYTDTITEEGIHNLKYKVLDNRGITTEKTIAVKIDKTAPELNLTYDKDELVNNRSAIVNVNTSDNLSGVKRVKLPNGNYTTSLNASYVVSGNGNYLFECEDMAGNITRKAISINGSNSNLNTEVNKSNNWTNKGVQINIGLRK